MPRRTARSSLLTRPSTHTMPPSIQAPRLLSFPSLQVVIDEAELDSKASLCARFLSSLDGEELTGQDGTVMALMARAMAPTAMVADLDVLKTL